MVGIGKILEPGKGGGVRSRVPWSADDCEGLDKLRTTQDVTGNSFP